MTTTPTGVPVIITPTDALADLLAAKIEADRRYREADAAKTAATDALKVAMVEAAMASGAPADQLTAAHLTVEGIRASYTTHWRTALDTTRLKRERPDVVAAYTTQTAQARLTVTVD